MTPELAAHVGREVVYVSPEPLGEASIRYFALAIGDEGPAPSPTLVCETNQFYDRPPDADGYIGHTWDLPVDSAGFVRGGNEYEFFRRPTADDRITVTWRLVELFEREGADGRPLLFVVSEARYVDQRGELLAVNRETNIHL